MSLTLNGQNTTQNTLQAILNRVQELENEIWFVLSSMSINAAFGDLLNKLGNLVGEPRNGRSDADYQAGIRLKIRVNISSGRATDMIAVAQLAAPSTIVYVEPPGTSSCGAAAFILDLFNLPSPAYVVAKMKHARAAATYGLIQYTMWATTTNTDILDSASGGVTGPGLLDSASGGVTNPGLMSAGIGT